MLNREQIIDLLRADVVPALGCTEPICVALCSSTASSILEENVNNIQVEVSPGIFKNGMSAGIPNFSQVGLPYAASLGALLKNPQKGLELLSDITEDIASQAASLIEHNAVNITIDRSKKGIYVKCTLTGEHFQTVCKVEGAHTNVVYLEKDGTDEAIGHAVRNMSGTVTGMICDGGKVGCALKVATGTFAALTSAVTAVQGAALRVSDGICAEPPEQCIQNMAYIGSEGMKETDKAILHIMQN